MPTRGPHVLAAAIGGLCLLAGPAAAQIAFTEGELYDADGRLLAKATGTAVPTPFQRYKA